MNLLIQPTKLQGSIEAIPSKSMAHRILICAALCDRKSHINCRQTSKDIEAAARCLTALGAPVRYSTLGAYSVLPMQEQVSQELLCGESGTTLRLLLPVVAALGKSATFVMEGRLPQRPLAPLDAELMSHGITLSRPTADTLSVSGRLQPGSFQLPGNISSQFVSGLLMALPLLEEESTLTVTGSIESAPYIDMTIQVLSEFGVYIKQRYNHFTVSPSKYLTPGNTEVEGDWSNAACWLAAAKMGSTVEVTGLSRYSRQGDKAVVMALNSLGMGQQIDVANTPDLVPILAVAATASQGSTHFVNAGRLRLKESDRIATISQMIRNLGGQVLEQDDRLTVIGGTLTGGTVDAANDHRIAMAAAVATTLCQNPVELLGAQAVEKSYPSFWEDYRALGGVFQEV